MLNIWAFEENLTSLHSRTLFILTYYLSMAHAKASIEGEKEGRFYPRCFRPSINLDLKKITFIVIFTAKCKYFHWKHWKSNQIGPLLDVEKCIYPPPHTFMQSDVTWPRTNLKSTSNLMRITSTNSLIASKMRRSFFQKSLSVWYIFCNWYKIQNIDAF